MHNINDPRTIVCREKLTAVYTYLLMRTKYCTCDLPIIFHTHLTFGFEMATAAAALVFDFKRYNSLCPPSIPHKRAVK